MSTAPLTYQTILTKTEQQINYHQSRISAQVTVISKLCILGMLKFSTLDPFGMGVEMEGGKPGWNDAMNGLPGEEKWNYPYGNIGWSWKEWWISENIDFNMKFRQGWPIIFSMKS